MPAVSSPLKKPPGEGTGPTTHAHTRGIIVGRVPARGGHDVFERSVRRARSAFTLVEVLAALTLMAIVIPVAVDALRLANLAGQVGQRKAVAGRIAERVLNESLVTGQLRGTTQNGLVQEGAQQYQWSIRSEPWSQDAMRLVTVQVAYPVQGRDYEVRLSTLVDNSTQ